jgi:hypothetical protein
MWYDEMRQSNIFPILTLGREDGEDEGSREG